LLVSRELGEVPAFVERRIAIADAGAAQEWMLRLLDGEPPADVFEG
jgi:hypothetical protein